MYKVINVFRDKYTNVRYKIGDNFTSDEPERVKDLLDRKLIDGVSEEGTPSNMAYQMMTNKELVHLLDERGVKCTNKQTKAELIQLLLGGDADAGKS